MHGDARKVTSDELHWKCLWFLPVFGSWNCETVTIIHAMTGEEKNPGDKFEALELFIKF